MAKWRATGDSISVTLICDIRPGIRCWIRARENEINASVVIETNPKICIYPKLEEGTTIDQAKEIIENLVLQLETFFQKENEIG